MSGGSITSAAERRAVREAERLREHARIRRQNLAAGGLVAEVERAGTVRRRHYVAWADEVRGLKREGQMEKALELLYECIEAVERSADLDGLSMSPWYTEHAAIAHRKLGQLNRELEVLQRYRDHPRAIPDAFTDRIAKARQLIAKRAGLIEF